MARKPKKPAAGAVPNVSVRPDIRVSEATPQYYINVAEISNSAHDFVLMLARAPIKPDQSMIDAARKAGTVVIDADVLIMVAPTLVPQLIKALTSQMEKY